MTCPRCEESTDREAFRCGREVIERQPLICTRCLTEWEIRRVTGELLLWREGAEVESQ